MDVHFCFRLAPELDMAYNTETNEPASAYCKVTFENAEKPPRPQEEYAAAHERVRRQVADQLQVDVEHVIPISFEEYSENQDDDEE